jgi:hypothetical protein
MAEPRNDADLARQEAAALLGLDTARPLCPADSLRIDLVCALRRVVDAASETVLEGGTVDLSRLVNAVETLIKLLPASKLPEPRHENDARERLLATYMEARARGAAAGQGYDGLKLTNEKLTAEVERLKAELAVLKSEAAPPEPASPMPEGPNVLTLSRPAPKDVPAASAAPTAEERQRALAIANSPVPQHVRDTRPQNEPWRPYVEGSAFHDRWSNRKF